MFLKAKRNSPMAKTVCNNPTTTNQASIIKKNADLCWAFLAWATMSLPMFAWLDSEQSDVVYQQIVGGDYEQGRFCLTVIYVHSNQLILYAILRYCQSRSAALIRFVRICICPAISIVAGYLCGDDYLRYIVSVSWAASGLFVYLTITAPDDLNVTNLLVALALAFANYGQSLTLNIVIVAFLVHSWFSFMTNENAEDKSDICKQNMPDSFWNPKTTSSQGKAGSLSPERQDIEICEISKHVMSLEVRAGCSVLYDHEHGVMFRFNDMLLSVVRIIMFWIIEQSLAEVLRDKFVCYGDFAREDLVLFLQDHHGVLYLHCGTKLYITGDELLSLMMFVKSLCTRLSFPLMLPSTIPMHSCKQFTTHGNEGLLLKWLFGEPRKCLMEKSPFWAIDLKQFHHQALSIPMKVKVVGDPTLTYHEEQGGCLTENPAADLQGQEITEVEQDDNEDCASQVDSDLVYSGQNEPSDGASSQRKHLIQVQMISRFMVLLFLINEILS